MLHDPRPGAHAAIAATALAPLAPPRRQPRHHYSHPFNYTLLRGPVESGQYTSYDYTQVIDDHRVLASVGTVGDAFDNALAESFVDSFKTELIKDRVWQTRTQLELAVLEYVDWFNNRRLHESLDDIPPVEFEAEWAARNSLEEEPALARTAPHLLVDESSQLVSVTLGSDHHQQMETN